MELLLFNNQEDDMKSLLLAATLVSSSAFAAEYIVKFKTGTKSLIDMKSYGDVRDLNLSFGEFAVLSSQQKSVMKSLSNHPAIEYIEPNYTYHTSRSPKDSDFEKQWGLHNDGKNSGSWWSRGVAGVDISALKAWEVTKGSKEIKIAVIDTGVDYNHDDLVGNIMINELEKNGIEGVDDDGNGYIDDVYGYDFANDDSDPMDGHGHGTHCAGVIGAKHDSKGIAGVNAHVQILPIKFLKDNGSGSLEAALKSIDYATARGVDIMSNSWGGGGRSQALFEAIERAKDAGITFVVAAGNSNSNNDKKPTYPANYKVDNVISVGALDGKGERASFSNYGEKTVHVFAPGVKIYSTVQGNRYKKMSGTSMACPHVAGVAGLLLASEPNLTYSDIKERLMGTSVISTDLNKYTRSGYVDAHKALTNKR
jgi:subtilisin family serine protease